MFTTIFIAAGLLALGVIGMAITIIVKKNGKFPETSVGHNPNMRKLGLSCEKCDELKRCKPMIKEKEERHSAVLQQLDELLKL